MEIYYLILLLLVNNSKLFDQRLLNSNCTSKECIKSEMSQFLYLFIVVVLIMISGLGIYYLYKCIRNLYLDNNANNAHGYENNNISKEKNSKNDSLIIKYYLFQNDLKWIIYNEDLKKFNENCTICLENFIIEKTKVCHTPCNHIFHFSCLRNYIFQSGDIHCPNCKFDFYSLLKGKDIDLGSFQINEEILSDNINNISEETNNKGTNI